MLWTGEFTEDSHKWPDSATDQKFAEHTHQWSEFTESQMSMFKVQSGPMRRSLVAFSTRTVAGADDDIDIVPNPSVNQKESEQNEPQFNSYNNKKLKLLHLATSNQRAQIESADWFPPVKRTKPRRNRQREKNDGAEIGFLEFILVLRFKREKKASFEAQICSKSCILQDMMNRPLSRKTWYPHDRSACV